MLIFVKKLMMRKYLLIILIFISTAGTVTSQQMPLYSQYMMNGFLLNPAIAGSVDYFPVLLTARQQWVGITDAPSTQAISTHVLLNNQRIGIGGYMFNDKFGPVSRTGIQGVFSYHLFLPGIDSRLGLGLAFKGFQFKLDQQQIRVIDEDDPVVHSGIETTFVPDADFGMYLYNRKYFVGLAATQLIEFNIKLGDNPSNENRVVRHYYLTGGYKFHVGDYIDIEPSLLLKGTELTPFQIDFNLKTFYRQNYWIGFSYRTSNDIIAMFGIKVDKYYIGYAFDYSTSSIKNYSTGSHEILLGINIKEGKQKGSRLL